jgi:hypothetical protein
METKDGIAFAAKPVRIARRSAGERTVEEQVVAQMNFEGHRRLQIECQLTHPATKFPGRVGGEARKAKAFFLKLNAGEIVFVAHGFMLLHPTAPLRVDDGAPGFGAEGKMQDDNS